MVWIAIFGFVVAAVLALVWFASRHEHDSGGFGIASLVAGGISLVLLFFSSLCVVSAGHVGVPVLFGDVGEREYSEGIHIVNPFCSVHEMSVRTENYWMSHITHEGEQNGDDAVMIRSSNGLQMPVDISVPYRLQSSEACWVYQNLGDNYVQKILRPALSTATRRAASRFTAEELYSTKLEEFGASIPELLEAEIQAILEKNYDDAPKSVMTFSQVLVGYIGVPDSVKEAIENKLKADQEQQAMQFQIMRERQEAERKKIEAEGIQTFQEIVSKGIDERLLRWKAIDATLTLAESNNSKIIIIGGGQDGLPVLLNGTGDPQLLVNPNE